MNEPKYGADYSRATNCFRDSLAAAERKWEARIRIDERGRRPVFRSQFHYPAIVARGE